MPPTQPVRVAQWYYLGSEKISTDGQTTATLPEGCSIVVVTAETAAVRIEINDPATANSMPLAAGQSMAIGPLNPLTALGIFNASSSVAYCWFFKEVGP